MGILQLHEVEFDAALCSKDDTIELQRSATANLLRRLPVADCDVWCDGSVGKYGGDRNDWRTRVAVLYDEGWYAGTAYYAERVREDEPCVQQFLEVNGQLPTMWIDYDDGHRRAYKLDEEDMSVTDSDGDKLKISVLQPAPVGAGAYIVYWKDQKELEQESVPAGVHVCSFTAEIRAMIAAIEAIHHRVRGVVRIFTDSWALIKALQGNIRKQCSTLQRLATALEKLSLVCKVYVAWVPSHCGFAPNELVDSVAKSGLKIPLRLQFDVPTDFLDTKSIICKKRVSKSIAKRCLDAEDDGSEARKGEVLLAPVSTGHVRGLHPVASYVEKKPARCECGTHAKKDVNHVMFRCPLTSVSRRNELPT